MNQNETRPYLSGTITCYNAAKLGEPERLRYYAKFGPDGRPSWPDRATEQEAEADLQEYAAGRAVKYPQEAVVPFNPEWQQGRLNQIQERLSKATPGPWIWDGIDGGEGAYFVQSAEGDPICQVFGNGWCEERQEEYGEFDHALILNAPQDINFLLHEVARARTTEATLRQELDRLDGLWFKSQEQTTEWIYQANDFWQRAWLAEKRLECIASMATACIPSEGGVSDPVLLASDVAFFLTHTPNDIPPMPQPQTPVGQEGGQQG